MSAPLLNVLIYSGPGANARAVGQTLRTLRQWLRHAYDVRLIGLETLQSRDIPWERSCALFVLPGGRDLPYLDKLAAGHTLIVERIRVAMRERGMRYLGICAGAYFAADRVAFEVGRAGYEVCGERPLKLVGACARGTLNGHFYYAEDELGHGKAPSLQALTVTVEESSFLVLYNGGCYFSRAELTPDVQTIAHYDQERVAVVGNERFCLSGVHFEYDPQDCMAEATDDERLVLQTLLPFEPQRHRLIEIILKRLGLNVCFQADHPQTATVIFTNCMQDTVKAPGLEFREMMDTAVAGTGERFDPQSLCSLLPSGLRDTRILYAPVVTSTQTILVANSELCDALPSGTVFVADQQTAGRGRGANSWISSLTCLQFTLLLQHPRSALRHLSSIQYLMAVAVAETANGRTWQRPELSARIKWPNDVCLYDQNANGVLGKLSGILVSSFGSLVHRHVQHVLVGVGINLLVTEGGDNQTACHRATGHQTIGHQTIGHRTIDHLNSFLKQPFSKEEFLAELLARFDELYTELLATDQFPRERYYAHWMHTGQRVRMAGEDAMATEMAFIRGIDDFGYLMVETETGATVRLEPDGNSFDMMHNLIRRKG